MYGVTHPYNHFPWTCFCWWIIFGITDPYKKFPWTSASTSCYNPRSLGDLKHTYSCLISVWRVRFFRTCYSMTSCWLWFRRLPLSKNEHNFLRLTIIWANLCDCIKDYVCMRWKRRTCVFKFYIFTYMKFLSSLRKLNNWRTYKNCSNLYRKIFAVYWTHLHLTTGTVLGSTFLGAVVYLLALYSVLPLTPCVISVLPLDSNMIYTL